jgi:hypothetical protein
MRGNKFLYNILSIKSEDRKDDNIDRYILYKTLDSENNDDDDD